MRRVESPSIMTAPAREVSATVGSVLDEQRGVVGYAPSGVLLRTWTSSEFSPAELGRPPRRRRDRRFRLRPGCPARDEGSQLWKVVNIGSLAGQHGRPGSARARMRI